MPSNGRPLILLAEDDTDIAFVTSARLRANGYDIIVAADGEEALAMFETRRPDLLLLDLRMPKLDGYQVCRIIKGNPDTASTPVILFSASNSRTHALRDKCIELGADDHIPKPFEAATLIAAIRRHLAPRTSAVGAGR